VNYKTIQGIWRDPYKEISIQNSIPLREVAHETVVIEKVGSGLRDLIDHFCQQAGFTPRIVYEVEEPAVLFEFVKAHLGVAFAPTLVKKQINEQTLTSTSPDESHLSADLWNSLASRALSL
jgi:DNA-binding transcriptional LysR family regulator